MLRRNRSKRNVVIHVIKAAGRFGGRCCRCLARCSSRCAGCRCAALLGRVVAAVIPAAPIAVDSPADLEAARAYARDHA